MEKKKKFEFRTPHVETSSINKSLSRAPAARAFNSIAGKLNQGGTGDVMSVKQVDFASPGLRPGDTHAS